MYRYLTAALFLIIAGYGYFAIWFLTEGFSSSNSAEPRSFYCSSKWNSSVCTPIGIQTVLAQEFHHLSSEKGCYLFESADGNYVLRLLNKTSFTPPKLASYITTPTFLKKIYDEKYAAKKRALNKLYNNWIAACSNEEPRYYYLHLNKTKNLNTELLLLDKLKRLHTISADNSIFILQKKPDAPYPLLQTGGLPFFSEQLTIFPKIRRTL